MGSSRKSLALFALVVGVSAVALTLGRGAFAEEKAAKPAFVLNVISGKEDLHAVTMALQLAGHALDDGRHVVIFLNVRATEFAAKGALPARGFADNPPVTKMLADLMARGAETLVCPHCMKAMGIEADDLIPGVSVASRESLFSKLGADSVVFTY